jgi:hypothetical protein
MSLFFFYKIGEQEGRKCHPGVGVGTCMRGEEVRKGFGRVNIIQMLCTHVCKWKNYVC